MKTSSWGAIFLAVIVAGCIGSCSLDAMASPPLYITTWVEKTVQPSIPSTQLAPQTLYQIKVQLSTDSLNFPERGIYSTLLQSKFRDVIESGISRHDASLPLRVVLIHDPIYFDMQDDITKTLSLDLVSLNGAHEPAAPATFTIALPRPGSDVVRFSVRSRNNLPPGVAPFSLAFFDSAKIATLYQEVPVSLCVSGYADNCVGLKEKIFGFSGTDSLRDGPPGKDAPPDVALTFVQVDGPDDPAVGVLQINSPRVLPMADQMPRTVVWNIGRTINEIFKLGANLSDAFDKTEQNRRDLGAALFDTLFPKNDDGKVARTRFLDVFNTVALQAGRFELQQMPSISVRFATRSLSSDYRFFPIGLMNITSNLPRLRDGLSFLGYYFRIDMPLPYQTTQYGHSCIGDDWVLLGPTDTEEVLATARKQLRPSSLSLDPTGSFAIKIGADKSIPVYDFDRFVVWMDDTRKESSPILLSMVSHHDRNMIFVDPGGREFSAAQIGVTFSKPSFAIINACKTGSSEPYSSEFIQTLNGRGVEAVVATSRSVEGRVAGFFLDCFLEQAREAREKGTDSSIAKLFQKTLYCVATRREFITPNSSVLAYSLLGNGRLELCKSVQRKLQ